MSKFGNFYAKIFCIFHFLSIKLKQENKFFSIIVGVIFCLSCMAANFWPRSMPSWGIFLQFRDPWTLKIAENIDLAYFGYPFDFFVLGFYSADPILPDRIPKPDKIFLADFCELGFFLDALLVVFIVFLPMIFFRLIFSVRSSRLGRPV